MTTEFETEVRRVVDVALQSIKSMALASDHVFLKSFPTGSCDATSYAIGWVLIDHELGVDVGDWFMVTGARDGDSQMHTWVEFRYQGTATFTIDGTLHQFNFADEPYVGSAWPGVSPSVEAFPNEQRAVRLRTSERHTPPDWKMALDAARASFQ